MGIKKDVISILKPIFGESVAKTIEKNYDDSEVRELYELAVDMLTKFMGENKAKPFLQKLAKKYNIKGRGA